jgi:hypothetical protein
VYECPIDALACVDPGWFTCKGQSGCSGHGNCFKGRCFCHTGWGGRDCSKSICTRKCTVRPSLPCLNVWSVHGANMCIGVWHIQSAYHQYQPGHGGVPAHACRMDQSAQIPAFAANPLVEPGLVDLIFVEYLAIQSKTMPC